MIASWHSPFKSSVLHALEAAIAKVSPQSTLEQGTLAASLAVPPNFAMGQLAFPCFPLAKELKSAPPKIAALLIEEIKKNLPPLISDVQVAGGYANFFMNFNASSKDFAPAVMNKKYFSEVATDKEQVDIEYSQPNTHKALHLGHMRNLFYGDAVCNLLDRVGFKTIRSTYPGDLGAHIAKVLWHLKKLPRNTWPTGDDKAIWLGKQYAIASQSFELLDEEKKTVATKEIQEILSHLQDLHGEDHELYLETREWSLNEMKRIYAWSNSRFDKWYFESECDVPSRELVKEQHKKGVFPLSQGAIGVPLGDDLGFALLLKSDGNGLYLTKDLELIRRKFSDPKTKRAIYIVDSRQKLHFKQLFKVAEMMGFPQAARSEHLSYESVTNSEGEAFSSRDARGLSLEELRAQIDDIVQKDYLERHASEWKPEEIHATAEKITLAALKYGMLRIDPLSPIKFILSQWIALEGETGPYLQYVITRCKSILAKAMSLEAIKISSLEASELNLVAVEEQELYYALYRYNEIVEAAAMEYRPNHLSNYLFDIGKLFNRFYKECSVLNAEGKLKGSRLSLVKLTLNVLEDGFQLLNIPTIDRM